jgi:hypothetical protein
MSTYGPLRGRWPPADDATMARHLVSWGLLTAASLLVWAALAAGVLLVLGFDFAA